MHIHTNSKPTFGSFLVGLYLLSVPVFSYSGELGLNRIPQIVGTLLVLYAFYYLIKTGELKKNKSLLLYSLFAVWSIASFAFAEYQSETEGLLTLIKVAIITSSAAILITNQSDFFVSLAVFFISIFITITLNFKDIIIISNLDEITDSSRFSGTFANANTAALYCLAIIWTGFILLFMQSRNFFFNIIIFAGIILAGSIIIYSGSRKGLLGLGFFSIGLAWFLIKKYSYKILHKFFMLLVVLGSIFAVFYIIYTSPFFYRVQTMFLGESSYEVRVYLFTKAINLWTSSFKNLIIGVGTDNFRFYNDLQAYSHSSISETLVNSGIIGFGLYFASIFSIISIYINSFRKAFSDEKISITLVLIFILLFLFFNASSVMVSDNLFWPLIGIISSYGVIIKQAILNYNINNTDFHLKSLTRNSYLKGL